MAVEDERNVTPEGEMPAESSIERWITDSRCSRYMMPSADFMINYREGGGVVGIADDRVLPTEGGWVICPAPLCTLYSLSSSVFFLCEKINQIW